MKTIPGTARGLWLSAIGIVMISSSLAIAGVADQPSSAPSLAAADRPLPFGVTMDYLYQDEDYRVADLRVGIPTPPVPLPPFGSGMIQDVSSTVNEVNAKFDWWALPMLNVHGLFGTLEGSASATAAAPFGNINVKFNGINYGGGVTLAGGWHNWFATLGADYLWGDVRFNNSPGLSLANQHGIGTLVVLPKIGYRFDSVAVWVGAQYQRTRHTQPGTFTTTFPGPLTVSIPFQAEVEDKEPWGFIAGAQWGITQNWNITAEGGLGVGGHRKQLMLGLGYRF